MKRQEYFKVACMTRRWVDLGACEVVGWSGFSLTPRFSRFGYVKKREKRGECQVPGPYLFPVPPVHQPDERSQRKKGKESPSSSGEKNSSGTDMMHGLSLPRCECVREMSIDLSGQPHPNFRKRAKVQGIIRKQLGIVESGDNS